MSGRNARLLRRIARRTRGAGRPGVSKRVLGRWWRSMSQQDRSASRNELVRYEARQEARGR